MESRLLWWLRLRCLRNSILNGLKEDLKIIRLQLRIYHGLQKINQRDILKNLKSGIIDLVIGTHRLLSDDVQFKNLGLLIIDEEQKFGVKAKEKLKSQREKLDVLTLTATPIPRTLNLAMLGIREISIIDTPPTNRLPIITEILDWDEKTIKWQYCVNCHVMASFLYL